MGWGLRDPSAGAAGAAAEVLSGPGAGRPPRAAEAHSGYLLQRRPGADEVQDELVGVLLHPGRDVPIDLQEGGRQGAEARLCEDSAGPPPPGGCGLRGLTTSLPCATDSSRGDGSVAAPHRRGIKMKLTHGFKILGATLAPSGDRVSHRWDNPAASAPAPGPPSPCPCHAVSLKGP